MLNAPLRIFRNRSLASIVANFNRMITDLEALDAPHRDGHEEIASRITELRVKRDNIIAERQQAAVIAANLRSLTGQAA